MTDEVKEVFSISELSEAMNFALEDSFTGVRFEGEISELTVAKSGHIYLSLKDESAQLSAAMWRSSVSTLGFKPTIGLKVLCEGRPSIYKQTGRLQMIVQKMQPAGEGLLQKKFLELKNKLQMEGLFDPSRKRSLPYFPKAIGVVTSGSGAVIHDIMVRIQDRMPFLQVYLVDVKVQGEGAAKEISDAIRLLNEQAIVDVIIVGRGGGSLEDLWAFNEEEVVRAIFASKIPIISSVGHETDISLSDLVADVRAPTPTAAAEMVCPKVIDLLARIDELSSRLSEYERWFSQKEQRLDEVEARLLQTRNQIISNLSNKVEKAQSLLKILLPENRVRIVSQQIERFEMSLHHRTSITVQHYKNNLDSLCTKLESLNPLNVLGRGFALVQKNGAVIVDANNLSKGDIIETKFSKGQIQSIVN
jgi:exodeoxyribonuclease VII large subunit